MRAFIGGSAPLPPPDAWEVIEALDLASRLIADGPILAKGNSVVWHNGVPCFCIVAAITACSRTKQIRDAAILATVQALPGRFNARDNSWRPTYRSRIAVFNDDARTTISDAIALLSAAKLHVGLVAA